jgi:hypothetical protein
MFIPHFKRSKREAKEGGVLMAVERSVRGKTYANKARYEMRALDEMGVVTVGNALSPLLVVKGLPGSAEKAGGQLFSGTDGAALRAAFLALGYAPEDWAGVATWSREGAALDASAFRQAVVALDPATLVACDGVAASVVYEAFGGDPLMPGLVVRTAGMRMLNLDGFEDALGDQRQKQLMWARLKQIPPLGEPY